MRHWWPPLLITYALTMTLLAARFASQTLVYRYLHDRHLNNFYTSPSGVGGDQAVTEPFESVLADLPPSLPGLPCYPLAREFGRLDIWTIIVVSIILTLISVGWTTARRHRSSPQPITPKD